MARGKLKQKVNARNGFIPLDWEMLESPAWNDLKFSSQAIYPYLIEKLRYDKITYGTPAFYSTAFNYSKRDIGGRWRPHTFYSAVKNLQEHGFIHIHVDYSIPSTIGRKYVYIHSQRWRLWGRSGLKEAKPEKESFTVSKTDTYI